MLKSFHNKKIKQKKLTEMLKISELVSVSPTEAQSLGTLNSDIKVVIFCLLWLEVGS